MFSKFIEFANSSKMGRFLALLMIVQPLNLFFLLISRESYIGAVIGNLVMATYLAINADL